MTGKKLLRCAIARVDQFPPRRSYCPSLYSASEVQRAYDRKNIAGYLTHRLIWMFNRRNLAD